MEILTRLQVVQNNGLSNKTFLDATAMADVEMANDPMAPTEAPMLPEMTP